VLAGPSVNQVSFIFRNVGNGEVEAIGLFVDDGAGVLGDLLSVFNSQGTNFNPGGKPVKLQGGKKLDFKADFRATAQSPRNQSSMKDGSEVTLNFALATGMTLPDIEAALAGGSLRAGVRAGKSLINVPESGSVVPEPGTLALLAAAVAALALRSRKS